MSAFNSGKMTSVELTKVEVTDAVKVATLVKSGDNWLLQIGAEEYIYYDNAAGGNKISVGNVTDASAQWTITITDGVATITNVGNTERILQFNTNANQARFVCYKGTMANPTLYVVAQ